MRVGWAVKTQLAHFEWLAVHQVRGWGIPAIAEWHVENHGREIAIDAIRKGIKRLADGIGLRLRAGKPGRPGKPGDRFA
jgi:hypothetical protein